MINYEVALGQFELFVLILIRDKADPEVIKKYFNMSKNAFKRAVGRLLKQEKVVITENSIVLK